MWVVKLGGSLNLDPALPDWLELIAAQGGGRVILVPGGGGFADEVRRHQRHWGHDDLAAHNMAVLAMCQSGLMLQALLAARHPALGRVLRPVRGEAELRPVLCQGQVAVWLPFELLREQPEPPLTGWDSSADTLALRLALRLHAERLVLVKSCAVPLPPLDLDALSAAGVLDRAFPQAARGAPFPIELISRHEPERLRAGLCGLLA